MLTLALSVARKDLTLTLLRSAGLIQSLLLGLLLIFLFSLSQKTGEPVSAQTAATIFWLASTFSQILIFNTLFSYEETNGARIGLLLIPAPVTGIWLGKALAGFMLLVFSQIIFLPAAVVFLGQSVETATNLTLSLGDILLTDTGLAALGALLGALAQGQAARESLLSLLVFPLLVPLLLAGITVLTALFGEPPTTELGSWIGFSAAFDAIFLGAGLLLFRFIYTGED